MSCTPSTHSLEPGYPIAPHPWHPGAGWLKLRLLWACLAVWLPISAQDPLTSSIYTAGTTFRTDRGIDLGYVLWASASQETIAGKEFAVYAKPGDPTSPGIYTRRTVARLETDPAAIAGHITRGMELGEAPENLAGEIDSLFGKLRLPPTSSLSQKLSIVLRAAPADRSLYSRLLLLGRNHPALSLCLGLGAIEPIGAGSTTFEIRLLGPTGVEQGVIGRVTLTAGNPVILPAPGSPLEIQPTPENRVYGHLATRLRWPIPDSLKRLGLLSQGYNLYRVTRRYTELQGWQITAPPRGQLASLAANPPANPIEPDVQRVNSIPILTPPDTGDPNQAYVEDDHRAGRPARAFRNGEEFYYFATARDLLGRDGETSAGTRVLLCDRLMPAAPVRVRIETSVIQSPGATPRQALRVAWDAGSSETITRYHVYRWHSSAEAIRDTLPSEAHPNRIAEIRPVAGEASWRYTDDGVGSPALPRDAGRTFYYTIRGEDDGACGGNLSPHSAPVFGSLRDHEGPDAPSGSLLYWSCHPEVKAAGIRSVEGAEVDPGIAVYHLSCARADEFVRWVEFSEDANGVPQRIYRAEFAPGATRITYNRSIPRAAATANPPRFHCRVLTASGEASALVPQLATVPALRAFQEVNFTTQANCALGGSGILDPHPPGIPTNSCLQIVVTPAAGTRETRVYRQLDGGSLTLIGSTDGGGGSVPDCASPSVASTACYYIQGLDQNGNPSAMVPVGDCVIRSGAAPLPTPMLLPIQPEGDRLAPRMRIRWVCPPHGIQRFRLYVARDEGQPVVGSLSALLPRHLGLEEGVDHHASASAPQSVFGEYESAAVRGALGEGPGFALAARIELEHEYFVFVRAVGLDGALGAASRIASFRWSPSASNGPEVPWPARPVADASRSDTRIVALRLNGDEYPVGVRIGSIELPSGDTSGAAVLPGKVDPSNVLFRTAQNLPLLPAILYRYQVPNAAFPVVSGDVTQVSPLMERIAHEYRTRPSGEVETVVRDPFIEFFQPPGSTFASIVLRDTQPVVAGARYVYLLVRFDPVSHEIIQTIPTNELEP